MWPHTTMWRLKKMVAIKSPNIWNSPPFIFEGSTIFAALSKQLDDLWDGGSKERKTNCEEKHLEKGRVCNLQLYPQFHLSVIPWTRNSINLQIHRFTIPSVRNSINRQYNRPTIVSGRLFSCLECAAKGGHAVDVSVPDSRHGHHQKVDTVPVGEDLPVVKVRRVSRVFQKVNWK